MEESSKCVGSGKRNLDAFGCSLSEVSKNNLRRNQQFTSCAGLKIANVTVFLCLIPDNDWEVCHLLQIDQPYSNCTRSSILTWTTRKCFLRNPTVMAVFDRPSAGAKAEYAIHACPWR